MPAPRTLGERVQQLRHQKNWTLEQLAREAAISKGFLSAVENGHNQPSGRVLLRLARALGASVDYLVRGDEEAPAERVRSVEIPEELANLAELEQWSFAKVTALLNARLALVAKRSEKGVRPFTTEDWREFADRLEPYLQSPTKK